MNMRIEAHGHDLAMVVCPHQRVGKMLTVHKVEFVRLPP